MSAAVSSQNFAFLNTYAPQLDRLGALAERYFPDDPALDQPPFDGHGGFKRLNKVFDGQLEAVLGDINEELWREIN
jgi:type I restriction enzyme R subunit